MNESTPIEDSYLTALSFLSAMSKTEAPVLYDTPRPATQASWDESAHPHQHSYLTALSLLSAMSKMEAPVPYEAPRPELSRLLKMNGPTPTERSHTPLGLCFLLCQRWERLYPMRLLILSHRSLYTNTGVGTSGTQ